MQCAEQDDAKIHSEIENLEKLRLGKGENDDSAEFCESYATQNLRETNAIRTLHCRNKRMSTANMELDLVD